MGEKVLRPGMVKEDVSKSQLVNLPRLHSGAG